MRSLSLALVGCVALVLSSAGCKKQAPVIVPAAPAPSPLPPPLPASPLRAANLSQLVSRAFEKDTGQVVKEGMERAIAGANFKRHEKQALASTTVLALADSAVQPAAGVAGALLPLAALAGQRAGEKMATTQFVFSQMAGGSSSDTTSASSTQGKRVFTRSFNASAEKVESGLRELKAELLRIARAGKSKAEDPTDDRTGKQLTGFRLRYASGETRGEARVTVTGTEKTGYSVHIIIEETIP